MQERRGIVPKKLNDKQVSELVIEHANGTSISALAKKYGIARNTVKAYISSNCNYGNFAIKKTFFLYKQHFITHKDESYIPRYHLIYSHIINDYPSFFLVRANLNYSYVTLANVHI